MISIMFILK